MVRPLHCGNFRLVLYAIDGLTSGGDISDFVPSCILSDIVDKFRKDESL